MLFAKANGEIAQFSLHFNWLYTYTASVICSRIGTLFLGQLTWSTHMHTECCACFHGAKHFNSSWLCTQPTCLCISSTQGLYHVQHMPAPYSSHNHTSSPRRLHFILRCEELFVLSIWAESQAECLNHPWISLCFVALQKAYWERPSMH